MNISRRERRGEGLIYAIGAGSKADELGMPGLKWINDPNPNAPISPGPYPDVGEGSRGVGTGFPSIETPVFKFGDDLGRMPIADAETLGRGLWLISRRTKELFAQLDPEAFSFLRVTTLEKSAKRGPEYWLCDVVRILDALDPAHNVVTKRPSGSTHLAPRSPWDGVFQPDVVGDHKIFRLKRMPLNTYCSWALVDGVEAANLTGFNIHCAGDFSG